MLLLQNYPRLTGLPMGNLQFYPFLYPLSRLWSCNLPGFGSWGGSVECLGAIVFSVGALTAGNPELLNAIMCFLFNNVFSGSLHSLFLTTGTEPWCCLPASECGQLEAHSNFPTHRVYLVSVIGKPLLPPSILYDKDHFRLSVLVHTVFISQYLISFLKNSYKNYSVFF